MRKMKHFTLVEKYKRKTTLGKKTVHVWQHKETGVRLFEEQEVYRYNSDDILRHWHRWTLPGHGSSSLKYWIERIPALARKVHG